MFYAVPAFARAAGLLVLTNDQWNDAPTLEVSGALVFDEAGAGRTHIPGLTLYAGPLLSVLKAQIADPRVELSPEQLGPIEVAASEILGLDGLLSDPPRAPASRPGTIDYPRWSNIYYAGDPVGDPPQRKRHLIVSHDQYNRALGGAVCVRTTTSERRGGRTIPSLRDGTIKAICVLPSFYVTHRIGIRVARPVPAQLFLPDMVPVAGGLREALVLP